MSLEQKSRRSGGVVSIDNDGLTAYKIAREKAKAAKTLEAKVDRLNILVAAIAAKLGVEIE